MPETRPLMQHIKTSGGSIFRIWIIDCSAVSPAASDYDISVQFVCVIKHI